MRRVLAVPCGRTPVESVALAEVLGRHLAEPVATDGPWPATDRSAMDGFAVAAGPGLPSGTRLPVVGESLAGHPFDGPLPAGRAIRIMTGAVVPDGADTVVPVEQTSGFDGPDVELQAAVEAGRNIRRRGSEATKGQQVLAAGRRLRAAEVAALAVLGRARVPVFARPRVAILATGDEVVPVEQTPAPHQVRESNSWALAAQVQECGGVGRRLPVAADDPDTLRALLQQGFDGADVLVTIGGISKGSHDLVDGMLRDLGVAPDFHGIQLKPGKPTWFGVRRGVQRDGGGARDVFVFGLPGNPASCFTVFDLLVRPLLQRLVGGAPRPWSVQARVSGSFRRNARLQATPVRLCVQDGALVAELLAPSPSGNPFSLVDGTGYALLPEGAEPGSLERVTVVGYSAGADVVDARGDA